MNAPFDRRFLQEALKQLDIADIARATIRQSGDIARIMERTTGEESCTWRWAFRGCRPNGWASRPNAGRWPTESPRSTPTCTAFGVERAGRTLHPCLPQREDRPPGLYPDGSARCRGVSRPPALLAARSRQGGRSSSSTPASPYSGARCASSASRTTRSTSTTSAVKGWVRNSKAISPGATWRPSSIRIRTTRRGSASPKRSCARSATGHALRRHRHRGPGLPLHGLPQAARPPLRGAVPGHRAPLYEELDPADLRFEDLQLCRASGLPWRPSPTHCFRREYPALRERYGIGRLGDAYVLTFLYASSSGTSHSAQHALAAMFRAAADGALDFRGRDRGVRPPGPTDEGDLPPPRVPHRLRQGPPRKDR